MPQISPISWVLVPFLFFLLFFCLFFSIWWSVKFPFSFSSSSKVKNGLVVEVWLW